MNNPDFISFAGLLVLLTFVTGVIWGGWRIHARSRKHNDEQPSAPWPVELSRALFPVILVVLLLRSFVVEPFRIPSGSMIPTLMVGDFILVNKYAYGLQLPVIHTEILPLGKPERGDVVVFRFPKRPEIDFIKRIVGLPGDTVTYRDKQIYVDGKPVPRTRLGVYAGEDAARMPYSIKFREDLGGVKHAILHIPRRPSQPARQFKVPPGHYFVMGDNRDNSDDSRSWGYVPKENLVGKAFLIWMSWDTNSFRPVFSRFGQLIQ